MPAVLTAMVWGKEIVVCGTYSQVAEMAPALTFTHIHRFNFILATCRPNGT